MAISKKVVNDKVVNLTNSFIDNIFSVNNIELPIDIRSIVKKQKIDLVNYTFDNDISGVLVLTESQATIGVNQGHTEVRKRFTIAHELGHYVLHNDKKSMFMDKVLYRKSSEGYTLKDERLEREANYFAANLLMPANIIEDYIETNDLDFYEDSGIQKMANAFGVSSSAMTYRLINLGLIDFR